MIAPAKVLDLVEAFGAPHGLVMEANCKAHTQYLEEWRPKEGGPGHKTTGGPGVHGIVILGGMRKVR